MGILNLSAKLGEVADDCPESSQGKRAGAGTTAAISNERQQE
jgi:hypothetical protein